jgi:hypothetical protein
LRLANLPNFVLDRLSRYEATLWRQVLFRVGSSFQFDAATYFGENDHARSNFSYRRLCNPSSNAGMDPLALAL